MEPMPDAIELMDEFGRWRARDVAYYTGRWDQIEKIIPSFELGDFRSSDNLPANPYMKAVIRKPAHATEQPIPVGIVSNTYSLAQHVDVAKQCLAGVKAADIDPTDLRCEVGLTELGEWMNLRVYFPDALSFEAADGHATQLRLECFNSVDATSRLVVLLGWFRFVCSNGMVIGETKVELRDIHNQSLNIGKIPSLVGDALDLVKSEKERLHRWEKAKLAIDRLTPWANGEVTEAWGKKAACRVFHICTQGKDVEFADPFAPGEATEKPVKPLDVVPGSPAHATNLYDVSQALSWVASERNNPEERVQWQVQIPSLVEALSGNGHAA